MKRFLITGLILASAAWADSSGSRHLPNPLDQVLRHQQNVVRRSGALRAESDQPVGTILPDAGQIAVLDDADGVFVLPAPFNLDQKTLQFQPGGSNASQYSYNLLTSSRFDSAILASATKLTLGDDDAVKVPLPFAFPFYGKQYDSIFVHSDGNATFVGPEASSLSRDLDRLVSGPPRIGPLFADLDPSQPNAVISFVSSSNRFIVTWNNVPLYADFPGPQVPRQTFQFALFPDGRIEFSYSGINVSSVKEGVVVGIAPGGSRVEQVSMTDFSTASTATFASAIAEAFSNAPNFDLVALGTKFYRTHEDSYDFIIILDTVERDPEATCGAGGFACAFRLRNWVHGIGLRVTILGVEEFDISRLVGSSGRLQNLVYMGALSQYPDDPAARITFSSPLRCPSFNSFLTVLGQEAGHRFLAYPRFLDPATGRRSADMLGRDLAHWSFYFNSLASVVEGNEIQDKGEGTLQRFETKQPLLRYSPLDQYLMGLRAAENVPTTFVVRNPPPEFARGRCHSPADPPQPGLLFDGTRLDITVPMIVAAEGRRAPDASVSPKQFRFAFLLLVPAGTTPKQADIAKLDRFRTAWEPFFSNATENRGQAITRLAKQVQLSVWPAAGLVQGKTVTASITLGAPASAPVTVNLSASNSSISAPGSVTVPAGSLRAEFPITANTAGVAELVAQGPGDSYETARAFLQVRTSTAGLRLERLESPTFVGPLVLPALGIPLSGGLGTNLGEPLIFRVRDDNFLPYPGLRLTASPSGSGSVTPSDLTTDAHGIVLVNWRLDTTPGVNTLNVSVEGQPDVSVKVQAVGVPQPVRRRDPRPLPEPTP